MQHLPHSNWAKGIWADRTVSGDCPPPSHWLTLGGQLPSPNTPCDQFERAERERAGDICRLEAADHEAHDEVLLSCWSGAVCPLSLPALEMRALHAEGKVDLVCRHHDGYRNAVSADQFGEQTAIKIGNGALKDMTLSAELVCEWIDAFPLTAHLSDRVDLISTLHQANLHRSSTKRSLSTGAYWMQMIGHSLMRRWRSTHTHWRITALICTIPSLAKFPQLLCMWGIQ